MNHNDWLLELKPGDEVIVDRGRYDHPSVEKVERLTATQIVVGGRHYQKTTGYQVGYGQSWNRPFLRRGTPEKVQAIKEQQETFVLREQIRESMKTATLAQLRAVAAVLRINWEPEVALPAGTEEKP